MYMDDQQFPSLVVTVQNSESHPSIVRGGRGLGHETQLKSQHFIRLTEEEETVTDTKSAEK